MPKIFVSHSSVDDVFTNRLVNSLQYNFRAKVWVDLQEILGGMWWSSDVELGLAECEIMILVVSPDALASKNVSREWQHFLDKEKPLIPLLLRSIDSWPYELNRIRHIVFHERDYDTALLELYAALSHFGIQPDKIPTPLNPVKTGNLFWLCHDLLELYRWLLAGVPKQWIDVGFRQCHHHANELGLDRGIVTEFREIRDRANGVLDWTQLRRDQYADEVKILFNKVAQIAQGADPTFISGPG